MSSRRSSSAHTSSPQSIASPSSAGRRSNAAKTRAGARRDLAQTQYAEADDLPIVDRAELCTISEFVDSSALDYDSSSRSTARTAAKSVYGAFSASRKALFGSSSSSSTSRSSVAAPRVYGGGSPIVPPPNSHSHSSPRARRSSSSAASTSSLSRRYSMSVSKNSLSMASLSASGVVQSGVAGRGGGGGGDTLSLEYLDKLYGTRAKSLKSITPSTSMKLDARLLSFSPTSASASANAPLSPSPATPRQSATRSGMPLASPLKGPAGQLVLSPSQVMRLVPAEFFAERFSVCESAAFRRLSSLNYAKFEESMERMESAADGADFLEILRGEAASAEAEAGEGNRQAVNYDRVFQYLDIVEVSLVNQIQSKSASFFSALKGIQELYFEVRHTCAVITTIRREISRMKPTALEPLALLYQRRRLLNTLAAFDLLALVDIVRRKEGQIATRMGEGHLCEALHELLATRQVLNGRLAHISCVTAVSVTLKTMYPELQKRLFAEFVRSSCQISRDLPRVVDLLVALLRCDKLFDAVSSLKEELKLFVRNRSKDIIKAVVDAPQADLAADTEASSGNGTGNSLHLSASRSDAKSSSEVDNNASSGDLPPHIDTASASGANSSTMAGDTTSPLSSLHRTMSLEDEREGERGVGAAATTPSANNKLLTSLSGAGANGKQKGLGQKANSFSLSDSLRSRSQSSESDSASAGGSRTPQATSRYRSQLKSFAARLSGKDKDAAPSTGISDSDAFKSPRSALRAASEYAKQKQHSLFRTPSTPSNALVSPAVTAASSPISAARRQTLHTSRSQSSRVLSHSRFAERSQSLVNTSNPSSSSAAEKPPTDPTSPTSDHPAASAPSSPLKPSKSAASKSAPRPFRNGHRPTSSISSSHSRNSSYNSTTSAASIGGGGKGAGGKGDAKKLSDRIGAMSHSEFVALLAALFAESSALMRSATELVDVFDQAFLCVSSTKTARLNSSRASPLISHATSKASSMAPITLSTPGGGGSARNKRKVVQLTPKNGRHLGGGELQPPPPPLPSATALSRHAYAAALMDIFIEEPHRITSTLELSRAVLAESVVASCDYVYSRCNKVLRTRKSTYADLHRSEIVQWYDVTMAFVLESEQLNGGRRASKVRETTHRFAMDYMARQHARHMRNVENSLEIEEWTKAALIPPEFQELVRSEFVFLSPDESRSHSQRSLSSSSPRAPTRSPSPTLPLYSTSLDPDSLVLPMRFVVPPTPPTSSKVAGTDDGGGGGSGPKTPGDERSNGNGEKDSVDEKSDVEEKEKPPEASKSESSENESVSESEHVEVPPTETNGLPSSGLKALLVAIPAELRGSSVACGWGHESERDEAKQGEHEEEAARSRAKAKANGVHGEEAGLSSSPPLPEEMVSMPVVYSVLVLLKSIAQYTYFGQRVPIVAKDVPDMICELVSLFNRKMYELVLGAGAIHFVEFNSLNAVHLCLASKCLQLLVFLLPAIRRSLLVHEVAQSSGETSAAGKSVSSEDDNPFERVSKDLQQHRSDIFDKFISQMKSLIGGAFATLLEAPWAQPDFAGKGEGGSSPPGATVSRAAMLAKMGGPEPDECIRHLMEETQSLRHVLAGYFPPATTQRLFTVIGKLLCERVSSVFSRFAARGEGEDASAKAKAKSAEERRIVRARITANVEWILGKLRTVGGCSPAIEEKLGSFLA